MGSAVPPTNVRVLEDLRRKSTANADFGFAEECRRQSIVVAAADAVDRDLDTFTDAALADMDVEAH